MAKTKIEKRGRKPLEEHLKKIAVQLYLERYKIDQLGGIEIVHEMLSNYLKLKLKEHGNEKETN